MPPDRNPGVPTGMSNHAVVALAAAMPNNVNPRAQSGARMRDCVTAVELMVSLCELVELSGASVGEPAVHGFEGAS